MLHDMKLAIFDLDGVLVNTAVHHFQAWKAVADALGIPFDEEANEELKGVSRTESLERILARGRVRLSPEEKAVWLDRKNRNYVDLIADLSPADALPGTYDYLDRLSRGGVRIALGSASKNAPLILERLDLDRYFDIVVDGTMVSASKPDPEVFAQSSRLMGIAAEFCTVFEDSRAGIEAARRAGMWSVGIGSPADLPEAHAVVPDLRTLVPLWVV